MGNKKPQEQPQEVKLTFAKLSHTEQLKKLPKVSKTELLNELRIAKRFLDAKDNLIDGVRSEAEHLRFALTEAEKEAAHYKRKAKRLKRQYKATQIKSDAYKDLQIEIVKGDKTKQFASNLGGMIAQVLS